VASATARRAQNGGAGEEIRRDARTTVETADRQSILPFFEALPGLSAKW
jgi:hypothetical protein